MIGEALMCKDNVEEVNKMNYPYTVGFGTVDEESRPYWSEEVHEYLIITTDEDQTCYSRTTNGIQSNYRTSRTVLGHIDLTTGEQYSGKDAVLWEMTAEEHDTELYLQSELQHPFRLTFLCRNKSNHILVQTYGDYLCIDIRCETKLVFLLSNTAHQCVVLLGLILYLLIIIFHPLRSFQLAKLQKKLHSYPIFTYFK